MIARHTDTADAAKIGRNVPTRVDVVIVGAGFAGLYAQYKIRELGLSAFGFETASEIGGTWYWNRYPGARCDVESLDYSYSFSPDVLHEWKWRERFATQPEILQYANFVADKYDLRRDYAFETKVIAADFDKAANQWVVKSDRGDEVRCRFLLLAVGGLSLPKAPEIDGLKDFQGRWVQTGCWPHEPINVTGQRVAVIGTGSSGIQCIPLLAEQAALLTVFQRTPNFSVPAHNGPLDAEYEAEVRADYVEHHKRNRMTKGGVPPRINTGVSAMSVSEGERQAKFEQAWGFGTFALQSVFNDISSNPGSNAAAAAFVHDKIRGIVNDPKVAEKLLPKTFPFGTKRLCLDTGYYATFNRDNVSLVDIRETPIERITKAGIKTTDAEYPFDLIVFATGFDAVTGPLFALNLTGVGGVTLNDAWKDGPQSYLGLMVSGFPNLFTVNGPSSPSVLANMLQTIEHHVDWIADCIAYTDKNGFARVEADEAAQVAWAHEVANMAKRTLYTKANSWYMGANVLGKPRVFLMYIGGLDTYVDRCDQIVQGGYVGFNFSPAKVARKEIGV
ncbi:flavin-containing monooxygenase [Sphingorhabdus sp.]|jgi:cyclohexanone monooxygenase|uniref:flavin-containing monooxygenase n=1 Tax=Sphingorhabdus sp. TaxID=1902408 RepID=UPI00273EE0C1|nr:NAD(P)/FAD-dependent oxidoreductase [Sphingorhabdus sp.]MDP4926382.1 NAD(P)/FAD-dependent oxidoreductase [Sphingorhabdus sp.]